MELTRLAIVLNVITLIISSVCVITSVKNQSSLKTFWIVFTLVYTAMLFVNILILSVGGK